ncbi:hypothetical protein GUITHDRAFT_103602 [Guillardia theta CCMP2712]|uniref:Uncharacterized protein n=1 Tax=Guillardia theta (strain CCMP2712) TaxID=905079 RepID=L1JS50_GUITC|nr:hypothetical protein GUITHDRAFT_103602 [Guillardia theta CCMP2712]EKX51015.1 hypothetical protein GUITHDRAFT_103602 [Guillardia theta CCMP2712]|eukprot:XP_005837995.1 hypothetical protein GUITHDRAFT_103602 [Guillardia theta CCMP2712]
MKVSNKSNVQFVVDGSCVLMKGKCKTFPCSRDGWRCASCVQSMEAAYKQIIQDKILVSLASTFPENSLEHVQHYDSGASEIEEKNLQLCELQKVIEIANSQIPLLQDQTFEATRRADNYKSEMDSMAIKIKELEQKLELQGAESKISELTEELTSVRHELIKQKTITAESKKQQKVSCIRLKALALEVISKETSSLDLRNKVEELNKLLLETIEQQQGLQKHNESLSNTVDQLSKALELAVDTDQDMKQAREQLLVENEQLKEEIMQMKTRLSLRNNEKQLFKVAEGGMAWRTMGERKAGGKT